MNQENWENIKQIINYLERFEFLSQFKELYKYEEFNFICNKNSEKINNLKDEKNNSLLHLIIKYKNVKLTKILVKYWINLDKKNFFGETALHHAINNLDIENINLLLKHKCNPLIKNYKDLSVMNLLEKRQKQLILEFKSLKYSNNNLVFCYIQELDKINKIKEQISSYIKKYWK